MSGTRIVSKQMSGFQQVNRRKADGLFLFSSVGHSLIYRVDIAATFVHC